MQVIQGAGARVIDRRINGDILFEDSAPNAARRNIVGGDLQAFQDTGGVAIYDDRIDGNLQCKENRPRPVGGGNIVEGNKEDQCRGL